ncbi:unnamed protein product [Toxocara canis]|uniref:G_PROTEIN_RECEP_F1_2 domain-containing protein n=1 Tax=Toxocara canis TaxID=6265 RepID=A0A183V681_TOXCA|nr:unnamed protein product [Toxocara canis]
MATERLASFVGGAYIFIGVVGFVCNTATVLMIATNRVYRLSAYTMMANVALADAIMMLIAGVMCGSLIVWPSTQTIPRSAKGGPSSGVTALFGSVSSEVIRDSEAKPSVSKTEFSYLLERRPLVTTESNSGVALYGLGASSTLSYSDDYAQRGAVMIALSLFEIAAWTAGVVRILLQARLTFQFFYPSLICTVSSVVYFTKPFMADLLTEWQFVLLHTVWLCNHMCNPFIYAYFNERMRTSYRNWLTCARLRCIIRKKRKQHGFVGRRRHNVSTWEFPMVSENVLLKIFRRSFGAGARSNRMSTRSARTTRDGNFVRNSLQMQSRDFEQLCEFMVRVNPLYDSSEGWRESSDEEEEQPEVEVRAACSDNQALQEPRSVVLDLGRQTVEHWARFAKKASI